MEGLNKILFFIGSGYFAVGAAAGFPIGFCAAALMMVR